MTWYAVLGIAAGVVQIIATVPYIQDILHGTTRPNIVSWSLWTLAVGIAASAQIAAGPSWSVATLVVGFVLNVVILSLAARGYGYKRFGPLDGICLILSLLALFLWHITRDPIIAIVFAILADGIAYVPTFHKVYKDPHSETAVFWFAITAGWVLSALSSHKLDPANLLFPFYGISINLLLWLTILIRRGRI